MTISSLLAAWVLSAMLAWVPPSTHDWYTVRGLTEASYQSIADDIATAALDPEVTPLFAGPSGRAKTALLLAAVASYESSFNATIARGGSVRKGDNDNGRAVGLWQTHVYGATEEGWTRADLASDRQKQITIALRRMHSSFRACANTPVTARLSQYAKGGAGCAPVRESEVRVGRALAWWSTHPYAAPVEAL